MTLTEFLMWCNDRKHLNHHCSEITFELENQNKTIEEREEISDEITRWRETLAFQAREQLYDWQTPAKMLELWELIKSRCPSQEVAELKTINMFNELHNPPLEDESDNNTDNSIIEETE